MFDTWYPHGIKSVERRGIFILNDLLICFLKQAVMIVDVQKPVVHPSWTIQLDLHIAINCSLCKM